MDSLTLKRHKPAPNEEGSMLLTKECLFFIQIIFFPKSDAAANVIITKIEEKKFGEVFSIFGSVVLKIG